MIAPFKELAFHIPTQFFFKKDFGDISHFCGTLIPLFWTSDDICPGFQSQGESIACVLHPCVQ